jgi:hypothetical protein
MDGTEGEGVLPLKRVPEQSGGSNTPVFHAPSLPGAGGNGR